MKTPSLTSISDAYHHPSWSPASLKPSTGKMWTLWLVFQIFPPVEVAKEGWWMTEQGALSRRGVQTQVGDDLTEMAVVWWDTVDGGAVGVPLIGDVDGDGHNEVVVLKHRALQVLDVGQKNVIWRFVPPDSAWFGDACYANTPALGDVDGDGVVEIVAMDDTHRVWILDAARQAVDGMIQLPTYNTSDTRCPRTPMYIVDLENDGIPGIVVGGMANLAPSNLYCIIPCASRSGDTCQDSLVWAKMRLSTPYPFSWIPYGDVNGDGTLEFALWSVVDTTLVVYGDQGDTLGFAIPTETAGRFPSPFWTWTGMGRRRCSPRGRAGC